MQLHSQEEWRRLTSDDGMSGNEINQIFQTTNGDIWIGTDKGISRYNGIFDNFMRDPVNIIFESAIGQLIARVDKPPGKVGTNIPALSSLHVFDGLEWEGIDGLDDVSKFPQFAVESADKLWVSTQDGLVGFDGQKWQRYDADVDTDWLVKTSDRRLWTENRWDMDGIASFDG